MLYLVEAVGAQEIDLVERPAHSRQRELLVGVWRIRAGGDPVADMRARERLRGERVGAARFGRVQLHVERNVGEGEAGDGDVDAVEVGEQLLVDVGRGDVGEPAARVDPRVERAAVHGE